ncbi:hypothetical protein CEUSTIGMA_g820.t1 [Chlamydomonas eustigma]|uniref:Peptidase M14 domain-containing protein n=1 Tax=Chlamydomonas eustigma TaxID=1157962 RepID=A0A250WRA1_9CHLO|nr:hypothetical protein CEUSTIGMA_g820.t1 [Chlamydomonas eustigma]|eukprot:GAX73367.1 hypothetical protein CEUSTIGMA_g820.t1 [Chlamydomonas eustigma]
MDVLRNDLLQQAADIANLNNKTFAVEVRHVSDGDYNVDVMLLFMHFPQVITVDLSGIGSSADGKVRHLIDFGQHGRELITSELGLRFLKTLADPSAIRAILLDGDAKNEADVIRSEDLYIKIRDHSVFKILPMENTRGRELVESGKLCERKNGRGVDPNRNWEVDWGKKEKDYDPAEEYPGTKPFSEPETQVVLDLAQSLKPHVWLNVHSGMEALFTPWDHVAEVPTAAQKALEVITQIKTDYFASNKDCVVGSGGKSVGYLAHGTATDYMFEKLKVPLPFTWEIFGDLDAAYDDCFKMFNPVDQQQFDATLKVWLKALFRLIELAPRHPEVVKELAAAKNQEEGISLSWPTHGNRTESEPITHRHQDEGNGEVDW